MAEIVIDFDGTCVTHAFPNIGNEIGAVPVLRKLVENGHRLILFTMRSDITNPKTDDEEIVPKGGKYLTEAVKWFEQHKIPLYGVQINPTQKSWTKSPKAYGHLMIDDSALGCPLTFDVRISNRPYVDWEKVEQELIKIGLL